MHSPFTKRNLFSRKVFNDIRQLEPFSLPSRLTPRFTFQLIQHSVANIVMTGYTTYDGDPEAGKSVPVGGSWFNSYANGY